MVAHCAPPPPEQAVNGGAYREERRAVCVAKCGGIGTWRDEHWAMVATSRGRDIERSNVAVERRNVTSRAVGPRAHRRRHEPHGVGAVAVIEATHDSHALIRRRRFLRTVNMTLKVRQKLSEEGVVAAPIRGICGIRRKGGFPAPPDLDLRHGVRLRGCAANAEQQHQGHRANPAEGRRQRPHFWSILSLLVVCGRPRPTAVIISAPTVVRCR